jgi:hypothetical protein
VHARRVERLTVLVEVSCFDELGANLPQTHSFAGLRACPVETLHQGDGLGAELDVALSPITIPLRLADTLAGVAQLGDQTGLLRLGESTGDLAHHLSARVLARRQIVTGDGQTAHAARDLSLHGAQDIALDYLAGNAEQEILAGIQFEWFSVRSFIQDATGC